MLSLNPTTSFLQVGAVVSIRPFHGRDTGSTPVPGKHTLFFCVAVHLFAKVLQKKVRPWGAGACFCATTTAVFLCYDGPHPHRGPRQSRAAHPPPPHTRPHRKYAVIIKASGARLVAMHAVKMTVPTQGSVRTTTPSVACTLPVNREGRGARAWGPWRSRGDVRWGDRRPRENTSRTSSHFSSLRRVNDEKCGENTSQHPQ